MSAQLIFDLALRNRSGVELASSHHGNPAMGETTRASFERLLGIACSDTGQARRVADFVLAELFAVDRAIALDMAIVFVHVARRSVAEYPEAYKADIEDIIRRWRPEVRARSQETV